MDCIFIMKNGILTQLEDVGNILHNICEESISKDDITTLRFIEGEIVIANDCRNV